MITVTFQLSTHSHTGLMAIVPLPREPDLPCDIRQMPLDSLSPDLCILSGWIKTFHMIFNIISPCASQTEGDDEEEQEWREPV